MKTLRLKSLYGFVFVCLFWAAPSPAAKTNSIAATAINALGIDLLRLTGKTNENALLSPYSIQSALVMAYAGADGATRDEMTRVLHYPKDEMAVHDSFSALAQTLRKVEKESADYSEQMKKWGNMDPITLTVANRLFGQSGYDFRPEFLTLIRDRYGAPLEPLDFKRDASGAGKHINHWVEEQTRGRITHLIPDGVLNEWSRLVLVNAIYLKAPWTKEFKPEATKPHPFQLTASMTKDVPMMSNQFKFCYEKSDGYVAVGIPYDQWDLQFLILLPDKVNGLAALEATLTSGMLARHAKMERQDRILLLPKFKLEPPLLPLGQELQTLGMKSAFDQPPMSANFTRIAPRRARDPLYISDVFHKTFLNIDEKGTEAAASTAVEVSARGIERDPPKPMELKVDHPFLFAIQHRQSGACLFLGRVTDPR